MVRCLLVWTILSEVLTYVDNIIFIAAMLFVCIKCFL